MKLVSLGMFAALAIGLAEPAQALNSNQENCVTLDVPFSMHDSLADEMIAQEDGITAAFDAFVARARACAVSTEVPAEKHDAYAYFAVANSLRGTTSDRLEMAGYPVEFLNTAIVAMMFDKGDLTTVLNAEDGITQEGIKYLLDYFDEAGMTFEPTDEATFGLLTLYLASGGQIVSVSAQLYGG